GQAPGHRPDPRPRQGAGDRQGSPAHGRDHQLDDAQGTPQPRAAQRLPAQAHRCRFRHDPRRRQQADEAVPADGKDEGEEVPRRHEGHDARHAGDDGRADAVQVGRPGVRAPGCYPWGLEALYNGRLTLPSRQLGSTEYTMVKIRLTRGGAKKRPFYHIIVTDSRSARDGRNIERVGFYNPVAAGAEKRVEMNVERVEYWVGQGAQLSDKVADLYKAAKAGKTASADAAAA